MLRGEVSNMRLIEFRKQRGSRSVNIPGLPVFDCAIYFAFSTFINLP
jgi:hypothetical protein